MSEIRYLDRLLHEAVYKVIEEEEGANVEEGILWYINHDSNHLWSFADAKPETMPDQSLEPLRDSYQPKRKYIEINMETPGVSGGQGTRCYTCGKTRDEHPRRRFCSGNQHEDETPDFGSKSKATKYLVPKQPAVPPPKGKGKAKGSKQTSPGKGKIPDWMEGHATRLPANKKFPNGQLICWASNSPDGPGCPQGAECPRAHVCPKFKADGNICGSKDHRVQLCPN